MSGREDKANETAPKAVRTRHGQLDRVKLTDSARDRGSEMVQE